MICAFLFPFFDRQLQALEELPSARQTAYKAALIGGTLAIGTWWCVTFPHAAQPNTNPNPDPDPDPDPNPDH